MSEQDKSANQGLLCRTDLDLCSFDDDYLGRKPLALALTRLLESQTQPFVIALDSPWGTGKTTFLKMWQKHLEEVGCPCIYFNAWESDFVEDPLAAFFGEMEELVERMKAQKKNVSIVAKNLKAAKKCGLAIARNAIPITASILTRGVLSQLELDIEEVFINKGDIEELIEKLIDSQRATYRKYKESVKYLKKQLAGFANETKAEWGGRIPPCNNY